MGKVTIGGVLVLCLFLLGAGGGLAGADEPAAGAVGDDATVEMLRILRVRMEARIKAGELLARAGRFEEALEAFRSVETLSREGVREIHAHRAAAARPAVRPRLRLERVPAAPVAPQPPRPPRPVPAADETEDPADARDGYIGIGGGQGAFAHRGGSGARDAPAWAREAVEDALRWLDAHQSPNGGWEAAGFGKWASGKPVADVAQIPDGQGKALYDPGVTGLALCTYLSAGYTNRGKHPYAKNVARGLRYLKNIQDPDGCFGPRSTQQYVYNHLMCALAMVEAYGMTGSPIFRSSAQRALDFIFEARNPYFAWRYGIRPGDNDTSVTGWAALVIHSAEQINAAAVRAGRPAPLRVDPEARAGIQNWLAKVTDPDYGRVGYVQRGTGPARPQEFVDRFPGDKSESMTAEGLLMRIFGGEDPATNALVKKGTALCLKLPPEWNLENGRIDHYYWYFGTLAMHQIGGPAWASWQQALQSAVAGHQRKDGDYALYKGSWDPVGPWGPDGGRVYSTAMLAMSLAVYFRYERVFPRDG